MVGDPEQAILAPAVGPAASVLVGEGSPHIAVGRIVFPHRAPLPLREIRPPEFPGPGRVAGVSQPLPFGRGRRGRGGVGFGHGINSAGGGESVRRIRSRHDRRQHANCPQQHVRILSSGLWGAVARHCAGRPPSWIPFCGEPLCPIGSVRLFPQAVHLADHVIPPVPVRQWVISVTDGVFVPAAGETGCDAPPAFLPARPSRPAEEFPLECPRCGGDMRLIGFILFYQCETIPGLRTVGNLRLLRTSCPRAGADPEDPHTPWRTARAATRLARTGPTHRLGRARAGP